MLTSPKKKPEIVTLSEAEMEGLLQRLEKDTLTPFDKGILAGSLKSNLWLKRQYESSKITLHKLALLLFGPRTEKKKQSSAASASSESQGKNKEDKDEDPDEELKEDEASKGHGRIPASAYDAEDIQVQSDLHIGDPCPEACGGRLYECDPGVVIRVQGQPLAVIKRYHLQRLRCSTCGLSLTASLPPEAQGSKYDNRFKALLAIHKYWGGFPFYRQEAFSQLSRFPLPDSTQWDLIQEVATCLTPIYEALETFAAQGHIIANDDTPFKILEVMKANQQDPKRKRRGMFTTCIYAIANDYKIYIYYSGIKHAGENLSDILEKRAPHLRPIIHMCDASSSNLTPAFRVFLSHCLVHARRYFKELEPFFPEECQTVLHLIEQVYKHEAHTQTQGLSAWDRLLYHQRHSGPLMDNLKAYVLDIQPTLEPNGELYKAMTYVLKHWEALTLFLRMPRAFLDNNAVEQALKIPIRVRKNALFYKTLNGAQVGSRIMSLIQTCVANAINPFDYLVALQTHQTAMEKDPSLWLPWVYEKTLSHLVPETASAIVSSPSLEKNAQAA